LGLTKVKYELNKQLKYPFGRLYLKLMPTTLWIGRKSTLPFREEAIFKQSLLSGLLLLLLLFEDYLAGFQRVRLFIHITSRVIS
jgi:hypothetical protein